MTEQVWPHMKTAFDTKGWELDLKEFIDLILDADSQGFWCKDWDLKYLNFRVDTRNGHWLLYDGEKQERISPDRVVNTIV